MNKLRKNSKKKSSYASNKIEGNPLSEKQVDEVIESDGRKHYLKPEQEVRNYFLALNYLEEKVSKKEKLSMKLILDVQKLVEKGASKEKIGLRGPMPPGVLFAVYDSKTGNPDYIPPEYCDIPGLLNELVEYDILGRLFMKGQEPNERGINEFIDQAVTALKSPSAGLRHAAMNALTRFADLGLVFERLVKAALKREGFDLL